MKKVEITWVKSQSGTKEPHRRTLRALGLRRLNHTVEKEWTPQIAGMVNAVSYMVKVEDAEQ